VRQGGADGRGWGRWRRVRRGFEGHGGGRGRAGRPRPVGGWDGGCPTRSGRMKGEMALERRGGGPRGGPAEFRIGNSVIWAPSQPKYTSAFLALPRAPESCAGTQERRSLGHARPTFRKRGGRNGASLAHPSPQMFSYSSPSCPARTEATERFIPPNWTAPAWATTPSGLTPWP